MTALPVPHDDTVTIEDTTPTPHIPPPATNDLIPAEAEPFAKEQ